MDEGGQGDVEGGVLGRYGVAIVPPGPDGSGWFVALTYWDDAAERYAASNDGPIVDTEEEALEEARKLLAFIAEHAADPNLLRAWEQMRRGFRPEKSPWIWW